MTQDRYSAVAIALHWAIAAAILGNLALGWWMHEAIEVEATQARAVAAFQLHKSIGLTVLLLTLLRLGWRLAHRPPPLPAAMRAWERFAARGTHAAFYLLMIAVPLTGWLYASTQWRDDAPLSVPTLWFGLFEVPHLPALHTQAVETRAKLAELLEESHEWLAWATAALFVLHAAAALKHHFVNRDAVLATMAPRAGAGIVALVLGAIVAGLFVPAGRDAGAAAIRSVAGSWQVQPSSEIVFWGVHAGAPFRGRFLRWEADLRLDPDLPGQSVIAATVDTASAVDGVPLHEQTLPGEEWFDVARYPTATFRATRIVRNADGDYAVEGVLRIKDRAVPLPVPLTLSLGRDEALLTGEFALDRASADLGMASDPHGEWVSRQIGVLVRVRATPP